MIAEVKKFFQDALDRDSKADRANKSDRTNKIFLKKRLIVWILLVFLHRSNGV